MVKSSPPASSSRDLLILEMEFTFSALKFGHVCVQESGLLRILKGTFFFESPFFSCSEMDE